MRLRDLFSPIVFPVALRVILRTRSLYKPQLVGIIVLFAVNTFAPLRVSAGVPGSFSSFEQEVVSTVGADNQVLGAVISPDVINVVDFLGALHVAAECSFGHKLVLENVSACVGVGMVGGAFQNVAMSQMRSAIPVRIALTTMASHRMADAKQHRFALPLNPTTAIVAPLRDGSLTTATTLTKARRITHKPRSECVCGLLNQSNTFRGLR